MTRILYPPRSTTDASSCTLGAQDVSMLLLCDTYTGVRESTRPDRMFGEFYLIMYSMHPYAETRFHRISFLRPYSWYRPNVGALFYADSTNERPRASQATIAGQK